LDHAAPTAERVCVTNLSDCHSQRHRPVQQLMIEAARAGRRVVRLKGGDPFVFGRGGEEAEALRQAGVAYEIGPGGTAGLGGGAVAGIPLTQRGAGASAATPLPHRRHASAVAFVTGDEQPGKPGSFLDWTALARFPGTL